MGLLYALINTLLYIVLLRWYWGKHKTYDAGFLLIAVWTTISVFCALYYISDPEEWKFTLWPFLYLFGAFLIYTNMFVFHGKTIHHVGGIAFNKNKLLDVLCYIYMVCAILEIAKMGLDPSAFSLSGVQEGALDAYSAAHEIRDSDVYSNQFEHLFMLYYGQMKIFALIAMFCYFCQRRLKMAYAMAICVILPSFGDALLRASRGSMIELVVLILSCYLMFRSQIPKDVKKSLVKLTSISVVILAAFLFVISLARFGDSDEGVEGSILHYLGHSMLRFNDGICDSVTGTFMGMRTFKNTLLKLGGGIPIVFDADFLLGTHFGTGFTTFVGMMYLDFGFYGTLLFGIALSLLLRRMCLSSRDFSYASLSLYIFFLNRMIMGVFVNASGADFQYYTHILVYFILLILFRGKKLKVKYKYTIIAQSNNGGFNSNSQL